MTLNYTITLSLTDRQASPVLSTEFSLDVHRDRFVAVWEMSQAGKRMVAVTPPDYDIDPLVADFRRDAWALEAVASAEYRDFSLILADGQRLVFASSDGNATYPIYYAKDNDSLHLGLSPIALAAVAQRGIDRRVIAAYVMSLENFYPFYDLTPWEGIYRLNPLKLLKAKNAGGVGLNNKTTIDSRVGTINELAPPLQSRLSAVIGELVAGQDRISSDLSGGLDSTSLCFWAKEKVDHLQTLFLATDTKENVDVQWARKAAQGLGSHHFEWDYHDVALSPQVTSDTLVEAMPFGFSEGYRYLSLVPRIESLCVDAGIGVHINGHAGDELFGPNAALPWSFYRSEARKRRRILTGFAHVNKIPLRKFWRDIVDETPFAESLGGIAFAPNGHDAFKELARSNWFPTVVAPEFATPEARHLIKDLVVQLAGENTEPLSRDRSQHQIFESLQTHQLLNSSLNRQVRDKDAFRFSSPFLDLEIIDLATSLRPEERFMSSGPKELLHRAKHPAMPSAFFKRWDKGEYSSETFTLFANHKDTIRGLFAGDSQLARLGLVDLTRLSDNLEKFSPNGESLEQLMRMEVLEKWLRGLLGKERGKEENVSESIA